MPEYPDIEVYCRAIAERVVGGTLVDVRLPQPFFLRTAVPPVTDAIGTTITGVHRLGKRVVLDVDGGLHLVVHLMIAGRFKELPQKKGVFAEPPKRGTQAVFDIEDGPQGSTSILVTEAGAKRRASLHVVDDEGEQALDPGGVEVFDLDAKAFADVFRERNHTLKRALTDPRILSGIGNAYSDEILHRARLSPVTWTTRLDDDECARLLEAIHSVLREWTDRLDDERQGAFPKKVTAFREEMAVHGKHRQPCPVCDAEVQRIVHGKHETNYCAACQTKGKLLADRALSKLLKKDWPRSLEELEALRNR